ncbi:hypothetical protein [Nocardia brasiliensis]|uniref:hypothetical protein n=1 Tax=Nocardia brasiliensis TaxID=37326 RepID=UPI000A5D8B53|nr:hypothetical protein [Nocardia brasiliensis]
MKNLLRGMAGAVVAVGLGAGMSMVGGGAASAAPTGCGVDRGVTAATSHCAGGDGVHRAGVRCVGIMPLIAGPVTIPFPGQWSAPGPTVAPGTPSTASCSDAPMEFGIVIDAWADCGTPHPQWSHYIDWRRC